MFNLRFVSGRDGDRGMRGDAGLDGLPGLPGPKGKLISYSTDLFNSKYVL